MSYFLSFVQNANKQQAAPARSVLIKQIINRIPRLTQPGRTPVENIELASLINQAFWAANKQQSKTIGQVLSSTFKSPQVAAHFMDQSGGTALLMVMGISRQRLPSLRAHMLTSWVLHGHNWQKGGMLDHIVVALTKSDSAESKKALQKIMDTVRHNPVLSAQVMALAAASDADAVKTVKILGSAFKSGFAERMHKAAEAGKTLPLSFFIDLAKIDVASIPSKKEAKNPKPATHLFTDTLDIYLDHGGILKGEPGDYKTLGQLVKKLGAAEAVKSNLIATGGSPRTGIARVLTQAFALDKTALAKWRKLLKSKASNNKLSGNQRAKWYLALFYVDKAAGSKLSAAPGLKWVIKAYDTSDNPTFKLRCLKQIVPAQIKLALFDKARQLLAQAKDSLSSQTAQQTIARLTKAVNKEESKEKLRHQQIVIERKKGRLEGQIKHFQQLLKAAKNNSNSSAENKASLQKTIDNLKTRLSELKKFPLTDDG